jgi:hypothetical protein
MMEHLHDASDGAESRANFLFSRDNQHMWPEGLLDFDAAPDISVRGISNQTRNIAYISVTEHPQRLGIRTCKSSHFLC